MNYTFLFVCFYTIFFLIIKNKRDKKVNNQRIKQEDYNMALETIGWNNQTPSPTSGGSTQNTESTTSSNINIIYNNLTALTIREDTTLGKDNFKDLHADSRYYDDRQFKLFKSGSNWKIEHCAGASLETIVNGIQLTEPKIVTNGMIVAVGYSGRGVEKLPITLRLA
jgi:hypothetical protein